jgi:hypothetical protein
LGRNSGDQEDVANEESRRTEELRQRKILVWAGRGQAGPNNRHEEKMKTPEPEGRFDSNPIQKKMSKDAGESPKSDLQRARRARKSGAIPAVIFAASLLIAFLPAARTGAQSAQPWHLPDIPWAFPVRGKEIKLDDRTDACPRQQQGLYPGPDR